MRAASYQRGAPVGSFRSDSRRARRRSSRIGANTRNGTYSVASTSGVAFSGRTCATEPSAASRTTPSCRPALTSDGASVPDVEPEPAFAVELRPVPPTPVVRDVPPGTPASGSPEAVRVRRPSDVVDPAAPAGPGVPPELLPVRPLDPADELPPACPVAVGEEPPPLRSPWPPTS